MRATAGTPDRNKSDHESVTAGVPLDSSIYEFDGFRLDPANRLLTRAGKEIPLPGRAFDLLQQMVGRPGILLTKEELIATIWSDSFVEESNLTVAISTLRRALDEDPHEPRYIRTVARRGYRFIADVHELHELPQKGTEPLRTSISDSSIPVIPAAEIPGGAPLGFQNANVVAEPHPVVTEPTTAGAPTEVQERRGLRIWPVGFVIASFLAALLVCGWFMLRPREPLRTLAVLPFTVEGSFASGTVPSDFALLGMTDSMISRLNGQLAVRPTSSILRYSDAGPVSAISAGREQEVEAVLTGLLVGSQESTTLKLRLIRVRDGITLWQDSFKGEANDLSQLEEQAGDSAWRELKSLGASSPLSQVSAQVASASDSPHDHANEQAYQLYLRGRYFWNKRTVDGLRKSADYFRQSIQADPNYALAYAGLADSFALLASFSVEPGRAANANARSAAFSAIHLDPSLAEPHASLGMIYFFTDWNLSAAETEFERAIRLNPNYAMAHHWYALDLAAMGRFPEALYEIHLAQKLDPLSLIIGTNVGWIEYLARDYPAALRDLRRVLELDPDFVRARTRLGMVEMALGNDAAAIADLTQAVALSGDEDPWVEGLLGAAEARSGDRHAAERMLANILERSASQYVPPTSRALILIGLDRGSEAISALSQAIDDHSTSMVYARVDPSLDPLRKDPAFQALLNQIKP
jgi:DNA-binding winged helix-turn-helix (wHTH) protein/tetratricopeptide (TPR) repeat protein